MQLVPDRVTVPPTGPMHRTASPSITQLSLEQTVLKDAWPAQLDAGLRLQVATHSLCEQVTVPFLGALQTWLQPPQFSTSFSRLTQFPSHRTSPLEHFTLWELDTLAKFVRIRAQTRTASSTFPTRNRIFCC